MFISNYEHIKYCARLLVIISIRVQYRSWASATEGRWICIHGTDIVDRGWVNSAIFRSFLRFFRLFSVCPLPGKT